MVKPGYKQTSLGIIPNEWEVHELGVLSNITTGPFGSALHAEDYVISGTPIITVEHLGESTILRNDLPMVSDTDYKRLSGYSLQADDIVFSRVGAVDRTGYITATEQGWLFSGRLLRIRKKDMSYVPRYLAYYFRYEPVKARIRAVAVGQIMPSLNTKLLSSFLVLLPLQNEQQRIAEALSDIDALISSLERLIAKKKAVKQGVMQELLTGKRRLPGFNEKWCPRRIGNMGSFYGGLSGKTKDDFGTGNCCYISFLNVLSNIKVDINTLEKVCIAESEHQNNVQFGDLLFNTSSETPEEVGMCAVMLDDIQNVYLNSFCFGFRLSTDDDPLFLSYYFNSKQGRKIMAVLAQGATRYNLSKENFANEKIQVPPIKEQHVIADILYNMDKEIDCFVRRLSKYRQVKQGMMQELLTGRIRLT